ncbi:MAG: hydrogenase iron-sulfur subunit [Dehalococcoidia bacterium]|nr:hydrogenase iron-sulfur subunit [Dehalococcoidia bacterium]
MDKFEPKIVAFFCNWCSYAAADLAGTSRIQYPPNVRTIRVMCSGRVSELLILKAFALGADGVLVGGCHPGDCHYMKGNLSARRRVTGLKPFLNAIGISSDRLRLQWIGASEGLKMAETISDFTDTIRNLGPNPLKRRQK